MILNIDDKFYISISGLCDPQECCFGPDKCNPYKICRCVDENGCCIWKDLTVDDIKGIEENIVKTDKIDTRVKL